MSGTRLPLRDDLAEVANLIQGAKHAAQISTARCASENDWDSEEYYLAKAEGLAEAEQIVREALGAWAEQHQMRGIDGSVRLLAPEGDAGARWPAKAVCDLIVTSQEGTSSSVYLSLSDVAVLVKQLGDFLPPPMRGGG